MSSVIEGVSNFTGAPYGQTYLFGLSDVAVDGDTLYFVLGLGAWLQSPITAPNRLVKRSSPDDFDAVCDFLAFERDRDPDRRGVDANGTGVAAAPDGTLWVSDAAGNWVAHLADDGSAMVVVAFPLVNGEQAVPTGVAIGPDGNAYVTLFRCQVPTKGKGGVVRVKPDGTYEIVASGLSNPIDVAFDATGILYVLEFAVDYAPRSGRVLRVAGNGTTNTLVEGLDNPTSLAIDGMGRVYVTEIAAASGGQPGTGRLLRFDAAAR